MPETNATSFGRRSSSAAACFSAAMTPKSPHPAHHHDAVWVAKSLAVIVVAMLLHPCRRARRRDLRDRVDHLDRPERFAVVLQHAMHLRQRTDHVPDQTVQLARIVVLDDEDVVDALDERLDLGLG